MVLDRAENTCSPPGAAQKEAHRMATPTQVSARVSRRSAASAARGAASSDTATVPTVPEDAAPVIEENPDVIDTSTAQIIPSTRPPRSQALPIVRQNAMAEDLSREVTSRDLVMPKLLLSQAMSDVNKEHARTKGASGVPMGNWYHSTSKTNLTDLVYFVPVDMQKSRSLFVQGKGVLCRSFDLVQGIGDPGVLCEGTLEERHELPESERGCKLRLWTQGEGSQRIAPPCGEAYNYPGLIILDMDDPEHTKFLTGVLTLRSTAFGVGKKINTIVMEQGDRLWHNVILEIGVFEKANPRGTFYVPTAEFYERTDEKDFERIAKRAAAFAQSLNPNAVRATLETSDVE